MHKAHSTYRSSSSTSSSYRISRRSSNRHRDRSRSSKSRHVRTTLHSFDSKRTFILSPQIGEGKRTVTRDERTPDLSRSSMGEKFRGRSPLKISPSDLKKIRIKVSRNFPAGMGSTRPVVHTLDNPDELVVKRNHGEGLRPIFARSDVVANAHCEEEVPITYKKRNTSKSRSRSLDSVRSRSRPRTRTYKDNRDSYDRRRRIIDQSERHQLTESPRRSSKYYSDKYKQVSEKSKYSPERSSRKSRYSPQRERYSARSRERYSPRRERYSPSRRKTSPYKNDSKRDRRYSSSTDKDRRNSSRDREKERVDSSRYRNRTKSPPKEKSGYYIDEQREKDRVKYERARLERKWLATLPNDGPQKGEPERKRERSPSPVSSRPSARPGAWSFEQRHVDSRYEGPFMHPPHTYMPYCEPFMYPPMGSVMMRPYQGPPHFVMRPRPPFGFRPLSMMPRGMRPMVRPRHYPPPGQNMANTGPNQNKK